MNENIISLEKIVQPLKNENIDFFINLIKKLNNKKTVEIVFSGTISNGKSTVVNAILEKDLLQAGIGSTTAKITYISKGEDEVIGYKENNETIRKELSKENIKLLNENNDISHIKINLNDFIYPNITFVDSPGINDVNTIREGISYSYVPLADVVVFVVDISKGITSDEKVFFDDKIIKSHKEKIFILLNGIDKVDGEDLSPVLESEILQDYKLFPVSAKKYLSGVLNNNEDTIEKSKFYLFLNEFNQYLENVDSYKINKNRIKNSLQSIGDFSSIQITEMISNLSKNKAELHTSLESKNNLLAQEKEKLESIKKEVNDEISSIQDFTHNKFLEIKKEVREIEDKNSIVEYIKESIDEIISYSEGKLNTIDVDIGVLNTIINNVTKYFSDAIYQLSYIIEFLLLKSPSGKVTTILKVIIRTAKNFPFLQTLFNGGNNMSFEIKIDNILDDIKNHFDNDIIRLKKEKLEELEFTVLGEIKSSIFALENSLSSQKIEESNINKEAEKLNNQRLEIKEIIANLHRA